MTTQEAVKEIKELDLPARVKAELLRMYFKMREVAIAILEFLKRHKQLGECLALGAIVAFLLAQLPFLGSFLALLALVTASAVGLMLEMRNYLTQIFTMPVQA